MSVIVILIGASLLVALGFLAGFIWAVRAGQYDDTSTPSLRVLTEEAAPAPQRGQTDAQRTASPLTPALSPLRGEGGATDEFDSRTAQPAFAAQKLSSHLQSESNRT